MLTILDHITLTHERACKNRTSLHFTDTQYNQYPRDPSIARAIHRASQINVTLIEQLNRILDKLGRSHGPTQHE